jgi:hypothetical protein
MKRAVIFLFFLNFIFVNSAGACDWCILSQGISPLDTFKGAGIRLTERYTLLNSIYKGTEKKANPGAKEEYWTTELTGFYGITEDMMLLTVIPWRNTKLNGHLHVHSDGDYEVESDMGDQSGLGDVSVLGRYTFLKKHTLDTTTTVAGLFGIKLPTGKTDGKTTDGAQYLDAHLQLGTGSTDFLVGLSLSHAIQRFSVAANLLGAIPTEGKAGNTTHQFGNMLNYDITGKYRVSPGTVEIGESANQLFLALGINGEWRGKEKNSGVEDANSGGHTAYLSPGIQFVMVPHWIFEFSYQSAIYHNLDGIQLGEDYRAVGGVTYLF